MPYGDVVLDHFRRPRNRGTLARPTVTCEGHNPLCGDHVRIELEIVEDSIRSAAFTANACAICTAAASQLTERLAGLTVPAALAITEADVLADLGAAIPDGRVACAGLPLRAVREALSGRRA